MRWPSFFGRGATAKAAQEPRARAPVREWASLPAIQRTGGGSHLTAPTAAFVNSLAGTHDPDLSLEPLGHHVSLDAPPGLVTGLARSVDTYAPAGELVGRPKPRKEHAVQRREFTSGDGSESSDEGVVDTEPAVERAMLSAPVVEEPAPALTPLTHLAPAEAMAVMHLATPRPVAIEPSAESIVSEGASPEPAFATAAPPVTAQRLTLGQSRRLGLGAPLPHHRPAMVQRATDAPSLELAAPRRGAEAEPAANAPEAASIVADTPAEEPMSALVERVVPLAGLPMQRAAHEAEAATFSPSAELELARPPGTAVVPGPSASKPPVVQRAVATPLPAIFARTARLPTAPIASERPPLLILRRTADSVDTGAETAQSAPVELQRLPTVVAGGPEAPAWQAELRGVEAPAIHRVDRAAPALLPRSLPPLAPMAPAVQRIATTTPDLIAFSPFASAPAGQYVQRAAAVMEMQSIQREVTAGEAPAQVPSAGSAPVAAAAGEAAAPGAVAAGAAPGQSDKELDELARKLHDRMSLLLRRDLLIQRERAGMVTDLR